MDTLEAKEGMTMVSTDISKAFDFINHEGLTKKLQLQRADIPNDIMKLIENYFSGRKTYGRVRTNNGDEKSVLHGVHRALSWDPVIFNLYVHVVWNQSSMSSSISRRRNVRLGRDL
ncbi:hypothetical protein EVAR_39627_1 [Eumeta japonica]|uniref:Uncharacterized protein n=1 Tax=Eumeta variegata TaxID=151549 RepID=A0A4C1WGT0_EUMVA|nr:hypothetical protein EVAR_39627_1 [Eumeta japonica]